MAKAKIIIKKCIQDSQDFGSDDEHMVSRVFFDLQINGQVFSELYVDIKQVVGSNFEVGSIEVGKPIDYKGPLDYHAFRDIIENYYRSLVGSRGTGIHITGGGHIRMRNNLFIKQMVEEFEIDDSDMGW